MARAIAAAMSKQHSSRRWTLAALAAGVFAAFTSRSEANNPVEVELSATPYGGTTSGQLPARAGGCAFAPTVGTTFAGVGGGVRVRQRASRNDPTRGLTVAAQGAVEYQRNDLRSEGSDHQTAIPADQPMAAGSVTVGYDWRWFGVRAGALVREVYGDPEMPSGCDPYTNMTSYEACLRGATYPHTRASVFPEVVLRGGASDGLHGEVGVGSYSPATLTRPGAFVGVGYTTRTGFDVTARAGVQNTVGETGSQRYDLSGAVPLGDRVTVGVGGAVVNGESRVDFDGRATVSVRLGGP